MHPISDKVGGTGWINDYKNAERAFFWHFSAALLWMPQPILISLIYLLTLNATGGAKLFWCHCQYFSAFTHFTPLVLVSFILHWCCRSIRSGNILLFALKGQSSLPKNLICKIIYSKENNCGQKSCTTFWNHRQYFLAVLSIRKCNCCLLVFALKGQNNLVRKIFW